MKTNRDGFTLIELLIVVVIIGILAAIAVPKFAQTRERAYYETLKSDLKNLETSMEIYYSGLNSGFRYTSDRASLVFNPTPGVTVGSITTANNGQYWKAAATHSALGSGEGCAIWFGDGSGQSQSTPGGVAVTAEGVPQCDK